MSDTTDADVAQDAAPDATPPAEAGERTRESYERELAKLRAEAAKYRTERNELRADAEAWRARQEGDKTELQRAQEAAAAAEHEAAAVRGENTRLRLAAEFGIAAANIDLLGDGDEETLKDRARRIADMQAPVSAPPSERPVESLRPGRGDAPAEPSDAFPSNWPV